MSKLYAMTGWHCMTSDCNAVLVGSQASRAQVIDGPVGHFSAATGIPNKDDLRNMETRFFFEKRGVE